MVEGGLHIKHGAPSPGQQRHACSPLLGSCLLASLTRPSSGRAKAGFASFVPPLK